jgi:hypothetical protein
MKTFNTIFIFDCIIFQLWFNSGLTNYDGKTFTSFTAKDGLPNLRKSLGGYEGKRPLSLRWKNIYSLFGI